MPKGKTDHRQKQEPRVGKERKKEKNGVEGLILALQKKKKKKKKKKESYCRTVTVLSYLMSRDATR